jgi:hypothetical protein
LQWLNTNFRQQNYRGLVYMRSFPVILCKVFLLLLMSHGLAAQASAGSAAAIDAAPGLPASAVPAPQAAFNAKVALGHITDIVREYIDSNPEYVPYERESNPIYRAPNEYQLCLSLLYNILWNWENVREADLPPGTPIVSASNEQAANLLEELQGRIFDGETNEQLLDQINNCARQLRQLISGIGAAASTPPPGGGGAENNMRDPDAAAAIVWESGSRDLDRQSPIQDQSLLDE